MKGPYKKKLGKSMPGSGQSQGPKAGDAGLFEEQNGI